ncbi:MAG: phosphatidate cytidylyltransferase [Bacteroidales bacterium]|nr:phosphatidate cytidylyltransferase [Bacteroidales bacterium]
MDRTLLSRTWSGLLFAAVLLGAVCWRPESACAVLFLLALGVLREFYQVWLQPSGKWKWLAMLPGVYLLAVTCAFLYGKTGPLWFAGLVPVMLVLMVTELYASGSDPLRRQSVIWWGVAYIAVPFALMMHLATQPDGQRLLPGFFLLAWVNDSGAYLIGITFGKHRLMPRISPLKSWEGFWGGAFCALAVSLLLSRWLGVLPPWGWLAVAVLAVVCGVFGDLFESMLKRGLGLKDSGRFMPGHGGMLDRFDAVLTSFPMVWLYLMIC